MIEVKAYKCDYCKHLTVSKSGMYKHESRCFHNPLNRTCKTCKNDKYKNGTCGKPFTKYCNEWVKL